MQLGVVGDKVLMMLIRRFTGAFWTQDKSESKSGKLVFVLVYDRRPGE